MKIYTSYFAKVKELRQCDIVPISIARWSPRFYSGERYIYLAPPAYLLKGDYTRDEYISIYKSEVLQKLNAKALEKAFSQVYGGKDIALLCYEAPSDFCHRHLVAEWLKENGIDVEEFSKDIKVQKEENKEEDRQLSLF